MSRLVLQLRQGDTLIVNGAPIRFRTSSRIELAGKARFLFGKQVMPPDQAVTPARRIYFALQAAHIGTPEERANALEEAQMRVEEFAASTTSAAARALLGEAIDAARADDGYRALKLASRIMRHEDAVLGIQPFATQAIAEDAAPVPQRRASRPTAPRTTEVLS